MHSSTSISCISQLLFVLACWCISGWVISSELKQMLSSPFDSIPNGTRSLIAFHILLPYSFKRSDPPSVNPLCRVGVPWFKILLEIYYCCFFHNFVSWEFLFYGVGMEDWMLKSTAREGQPSFSKCFYWRLSNSTTYLDTGGTPQATWIPPNPESFPSPKRKKEK